MRKKWALYSATGFTLLAAFFNLIEAVYGIYVTKNAMDILSPSGEDLMNMESAIDNLVQAAGVAGAMVIAQCFVFYAIMRWRPTPA